MPRQTKKGGLTLLNEKDIVKNTIKDNVTKRRNNVVGSANSKQYYADS